MAAAELAMGAFLDAPSERFLFCPHDRDRAALRRRSPRSHAVPRAPRLGFALPVRLVNETALFVSDPARLRDEALLAADRLYFGNEVCPRLLPRPAELRQVLARTRDAGKPITFVTPYLAQPDLEPFARLLDVLAREAPNAEIVVNDWGVHRMLRERAGGFGLVFGRLLHKLKRDPMIPRYLESGGAGEAHLRGTPVAIPGFLRSLRALGFARIEYEHLAQGLEGGPGDEHLELPGSLYYPFVLVSTSRTCPTASLHQHPDRAPYPLPGCARECRGYTLRIEREHGMPLRLKGNSYFYENPAPPTPPSGWRIDRWVHQPALPM